MEKTLIILKPDTIKRKLIGEIISRIEKKNFNIINMKMVIVDRNTMEEHYAHVKKYPIYEEMIDFMISSPVVIMIVEGQNVIKTIRNIIGETNSFEAMPGTIRGDFGSHRYQNLIHASDSVESFEIEQKRFFPDA